MLYTFQMLYYVLAILPNPLDNYIRLTSNHVDNPSLQNFFRQLYSYLEYPDVISNLNQYFFEHQNKNSKKNTATEVAITSFKIINSSKCQLAFTFKIKQSGATKCQLLSVSFSLVFKVQIQHVSQSKTSLKCSTVD